jgi:integrase/recombinase XerC
MPGSIPDAIQSFFNYLKFEKRYSPHTLVSYQNDINSFFLYVKEQFGEVKLSEITHSFVRSWLAGMKDKKMTAKSINRKISSLRSFFKHQLKQGIIQSTPMANVTAPKVSKRLPVFMKETETQQLIDTLDRSTEDWKTLNARVVITLFYATGMRLSELIGLREKQIDESRSQIRVLGKGNKERLIPVSRELLVMLDEYKQEKKKQFGDADDSLLVTEKGKRMYPRYAWQMVNKYLGESSTLDKKSPHVLRHTFATHLMNNGADLNAVKELLGHASLAATQVYTHNTIEKLKNVHKKAHPKG